MVDLHHKTNNRDHPSRPFDTDYLNFHFFDRLCILQEENKDKQRADMSDNIDDDVLLDTVLPPINGESTDTNTNTITSTTTDQVNDDKSSLDHLFDFYVSLVILPSIRMVTVKVLPKNMKRSHRLKRFSYLIQIQFKVGLITLV